MNKLKWMINRLSVMSPLEVGYRVKDAVKKKIEEAVLKDCDPEITIKDKQIKRYYDGMETEDAASVFSRNFSWNEDVAKQLLAHRFSFFSFVGKDFEKEIDWHKDYKNNKCAPINYSKSINYRDSNAIGDIKYIWEHNRHLHLVQLSKAYYLTVNVDYKNEVVSQIDSWIKSNPYMQGVNWESSLELAIRLISWSWVWNFIGDIDDEFKRVWLECIYKHCDVISKNFSKYSSANNHLIGEAAGLLIAGIVWPFKKKSDVWVKKSFSVLVSEMEKQNYADGVNKEQAISYQQFVLDFFILAGLVGKKNGVKFPKKYWERIEQMLVYVASLMDKDGNMPNIGDADDGYAIRLSYEVAFNPFKSLLSTGAVIFNRGDFKTKAGFFDEKSFWLLGIEGAETFKALEGKQFEAKKRFDDGRYYILSANEGKVDEIKSVFDCGPLGYLSLAAHGHADAMSFTLSVGGREFIVDPGTYAYHAQKKWREYFRGTSAHNTIRIDKENQSVSGGNFMWLKKAQARLIDFEDNENICRVKAEHEGYKRLSDPVVHRREMAFDKIKHHFKIIDSISAKKSHFIEQCFHFSRDCEVVQSGENEFTVKNGDVCIILFLDDKLKSELYKGSFDPIFGWESKRFDVKQETITLVNSCEINGKSEFITQIIVK